MMLFFGESGRGGKNGMAFARGERKFARLFCEGTHQPKILEGSGA